MHWGGNWGYPRGHEIGNSGKFGYRRLPISARLARFGSLTRNLEGSLERFSAGGFLTVRATSFYFPDATNTSEYRRGAAGRSQRLGGLLQFYARAG